MNTPGATSDSPPGPKADWLRVISTRLDGNSRARPDRDSAYSAVWAEARQQALTEAQYRSPLGRRPYDLRHYADSWVMCPAVTFLLLGAAGLVPQSA